MNQVYTKSMSIHCLFEERLVSFPDHVAITHEGKTLSYSQLNEKANQLAHHLQTLGVGHETIVAVCLERSFEFGIC